MAKDLDGKTARSSGYNAITNNSAPRRDDKSGHGTPHRLASRSTATGPVTESTTGIAPNARSGGGRAFDSNGKGTYANVIRGIDWIVANKATHNIRVLNCSFSAPVRSWYWQDPLNQAIMKAWKAGIVVVASAGNGGPKPMTIGVPGNVPYVITVGAMTDRYTPANGIDDKLASFSAAGPDLRGLCQAGRGGARAGTSTAPWTTEPPHRENASGVRHDERPVLHDVRHVAVGRRGERNRRPHDPGESDASLRTT